MSNCEVLFCEYYAAAQSLKNVWTRLASTYGCIKIVLSTETLAIIPHWFSKWLICVLRLDLYHEIPIKNIEGVMKIGKWFNYGKVELCFRTETGKEEKLLLYMKKYQEFVDQVTSVMNR